MKIVNASHQILSKEGKTPYQFIEEIGRKCYKSEDKITEDSAVKFVQGLCKRKHFAMIEHYWVHLIYTGKHKNFYNAFYLLLNNSDMEMGYDPLKYIHITSGSNIYISAPLRVFFDLIEASDNGYELPYVLEDMCACVVKMFSEIFDTSKLPPIFSGYGETHGFIICDEVSFIQDMKENLVDRLYINVDKEIMKHSTHTVLFICDRGVSHELVRHRPCSFAQESTRYCNYGKGQFGNEITVIKPLFFEDNSPKFEAWKDSCSLAESKYFELSELGATPQEARSVLPNSLKTEIIVTANEVEWQHIVDLRAKGTTGKPHPQMVEVMTPVYEELKTITGGRIQ